MPVDEVDRKIEHACLRMQIANQSRAWICPLAGAVVPRTPQGIANAKRPATKQ